MTQVRGTSDGPGVAGVVGDAGATDNDGVQGFSASNNRAGVIGVNAQSGVGVKGVSEQQDGVQGFSKSLDHFGVVGDNQVGAGVRGQSIGHDGVQGVTHAAGKAGVVGVCDDPIGGNGVLGRSSNASGVVGQSLSGIGVLGVGGQLAGRFEGNVEVTGDLMLTGGDVAEQFAIATQSVSADETGPGTVVVLDGDGALTPCARPYDTCVAGVVSRAGDRVPALVLDRQHVNGAMRLDIAVVGKVWCQADAASRAIQVGDLLTTSSRPGHAMAAVDREAAFGAVIGKALTPLASGTTGLVLTLVGLG
ncbi:hypothetical protein ABT224_11385 [Streptomyces sp. NPDC001584]|uniref:hypothetical protein n=1 Tax=Streptomyces sp. NPDC001584 TaxID=3154521 RepID=UPI003328EFD8